VRERRYLGLAFAFSHLVHGVLIQRYASGFPELFWAKRSLLSSLPGMTGYLFIVLMTLTSFKAPMRWLGAANWKRLHGVGSWVIVSVFCLSFYKRIPLGPEYALAFALTVAAISIKLMARLVRRNRRLSPSLSV
jgi:DMSO/TMAO reductase YedYZ heme-binding membrane subunit